MKSALIGLMLVFLMIGTAFAQDSRNMWLRDSSVSGEECRAVCGLERLSPLSSGESREHNRPFYVCSVDVDSHGARAGYNLDGETFCSVGSGSIRNFGTFLAQGSSKRQYAGKSCLCQTGPVTRANWVSGSAGQDCATACTEAGVSAVATGCYSGSPHSGKRFHVCSIDAAGWRPGFNIEGDAVCTTGSGGKTFMANDAKQCLCYDSRLPNSCVSGLVDAGQGPGQPLPGPKPNPNPNPNPNPPSTPYYSYYFRVNCPSTVTACFVEGIPARNEQEARAIVQSRNANCRLTTITAQEYYKGCR